jgi:hypothetical protein
MSESSILKILLPGRFTAGIEPVGGGEKWEERNDIPVVRENMIHSLQFGPIHCQFTKLRVKSDHLCDQRVAGGSHPCWRRWENDLCSVRSDDFVGGEQQKRNTAANKHNANESNI